MREAGDATDEKLADLRTIADYQFGAGAGDVLFPPDEALSVTTTSSGRPRQVIADAGRVVSYGTTGLFTLGVEGGRRLLAGTDAPRYRVAVGDESVPFVSDGKNAFAKFVTAVDPEIRSGDEVLVVHDETLLAVGRAELSAGAIEQFETGMAVKVREGVGDGVADDVETGGGDSGERH